MQPAAVTDARQPGSTTVVALRSARMAGPSMLAPARSASTLEQTALAPARGLIAGEAVHAHDGVRSRVESRLGAAGAAVRPLPAAPAAMHSTDTDSITSA